MTRTQATIHYLEAVRGAWHNYQADMGAALEAREAAYKEADEAYRAADKHAWKVREALEQAAFKDYEAAKKQEEE